MDNVNPVHLRLQTLINTGSELLLEQCADSYWDAAGGRNSQQPEISRCRFCSRMKKRMELAEVTLSDRIQSVQLC